MGLDARTGGRLTEPLFDVSGDDEFTDTEDTVTITIDGVDVPVPISGKGSEVGIIPTPGLLSNYEITHAYEAGTSGDIEESTLRFGDADFGRQSWRQLR
jgi:type IV pilus assembly protein PilY1